MMILSQSTAKTFFFFSLFCFVVQRDNFTIIIKAAKHITLVCGEHVPGSPHSFPGVIVMVKLGHT